MQPNLVLGFCNVCELVGLKPKNLIHFHWDQVDDNCDALNLDPVHCSPKDTHILPYMPWLTVTYWCSAVSLRLKRCDFYSATGTYRELTKRYDCLPHHFAPKVCTPAYSRIVSPSCSLVVELRLLSDVSSLDHSSPACCLLQNAPSSATVWD